MKHMVWLNIFIGLIIINFFGCAENKSFKKEQYEGKIKIVIVRNGPGNISDLFFFQEKNGNIYKLAFDSTSIFHGMEKYTSTNCYPLVIQGTKYFINSQSLYLLNADILNKKDSLATGAFSVLKIKKAIEKVKANGPCEGNFALSTTAGIFITDGIIDIKYTEKGLALSGKGAIDINKAANWAIDEGYEVNPKR